MSHQPGHQHQTPERDSPGWKRVIARGCGLRHYPMDGDWDCTHGYTWACEDCPIGIEAQERAGEDPAAEPTYITLE